MRHKQNPNLYTNTGIDKKVLLNDLYKELKYFERKRSKVTKEDPIEDQVSSQVEVITTKYLINLINNRF